MDITDARLVVSARDEEAFRRLYTRHTPRMLALAIRLLGHRNNPVEDVMQESWMRALQRLPDFRWESQLSTWLGGIVINCCREQWPSREECVDDVEAISADIPFPSVLTRMDLERALFSLPVGYRSVLVLHDIEGYTHEEIGVLLRIDAGTSKSQLSRARGAMRRRLQP